MKRRDFIKHLGGTAVVWPLAARAQQASSVPKVGLLFPGPPAVAERRADRIRDGMRAAGFAEPDQVSLLTRASGGDPTKLASAMDEFIATKVDVILTVGTPALRLAHAATNTISIVGNDLESDPIESGWIESYTRPGGNITGIFLDFPDFGMKWMELLKETIPGLTNIIAMWDPATPTVQTRAIAAAADILHIKVDVVELGTAEKFASVLEAVSARHPNALAILPSPLFGTGAKELAELTLKYGLPSIGYSYDMSHSGGLLSYGPDFDDIYREQGLMAGKVLQGTKPADLPAERPARFELIVNLKTAKAFNLAIPASLLLRADEVIE